MSHPILQRPRAPQLLLRFFQAGPARATRGGHTSRVVGLRPTLGIPRWRLLILLSLLLLSATVSLASSEVVQKAHILVNVDGRMTPRALPRTGTAPIAVSIASQISTTDQSSPPPLQTLQVEINRHGRLDYEGLPTCAVSQIQPASDSRALASCRSALVGEGKFIGTSTVAASSPYPIEGRMLVFNGKQHGQPVLLGHIYSRHPFATSFVITFQVSNGHRGTYGTTFTANLAKSLGPERTLTGISLTLQRRYNYRGIPHSFLSAGCPAPKGIRRAPFPLARISFAFADGTKLSSSPPSSCQVRG